MEPILDLRIISSALKHGVTEAQIWDCVFNIYIPPTVVAGHEPPALILLGITPDGLHLELGVESEGDGLYRVFHAMPMRERDRRWWSRQKRRKR